VTVLFWVLALITAASGFAVFRFNSMARVTFSLLVSFMGSGGLLILLGMDYLGVVLILMMVMEMVIMAVFMVAFMMNPAGLMPMSMSHNRYASLAISVTTFLLLGAGIFVVRWPTREGVQPTDPTFQLGMALMGSQMLTMITLGLGLFATMVATVVLATNRGRYDRLGDDLKRRPATDPARGGIGR